MTEKVKSSMTDKKNSAARCEKFLYKTESKDTGRESCHAAGIRCGNTYYDSLDCSFNGHKGCTGGVHPVDRGYSLVHLRVRKFCRSHCGGSRQSAGGHPSRIEKRRRCQQDSVY